VKRLSRLFETAKKELEGFASDRRALKRYTIPLKLNYYAPISDCHGESETKDICKKGLRFPVNTKIPTGTVLDLRIEDPCTKAFISSKAKVMWAEEFVTGDDAGDVTYEVGVRLLRKHLY